MKNLLLLIIAMMLFSSCDTEDTLTSETNQYSIDGKWTVTDMKWKALYTDIDGTSSYVYNYQYDTPDISFTFKNGIAHVDLRGKKAIAKYDYNGSEIFLEYKTSTGHYYEDWLDSLSITYQDEYFIECYNYNDTSMKFILVHY